MALFPYKAAMQLSLVCASCALFAAQPTQEAQFLKRMKEYWKEGDFETAKRQIRAYLEQNPSSSLQEEMHLLLGDLYLKEGNFDSALEEYGQIAKEDLQEKVFYNKVLCFYETNQVSELANVSGIFSTHPKLTSDQKNSIRYLCASSLFEYFMSSEEKDSALSVRAKELFESCAGTSFETLSFYPLAKLSELAGNLKQAASYYEAASSIYPESTIQFLFQAALLRAEIAPELAIATFEQIFSIPSPKQSEALYNCLLLQYKTKQFKEFVSSYEKNHHLLNEDQEILSLSFFGKSLYHLGEFEKAIEPLTNTLISSKSPAAQKTAQLMILECAHKTENLELYQKMFRNPSHPLINDENYSKAHLVYLNLLKSQERFPEFLEEAKAFVSQNLAHADREQVLWDISYYLYQDKNWKESDASLASFTEQYPESKSKSNAWRLQLNCALFELQSSPSDQVSTYRKNLIEKISLVLPQNEVLSSSEKETFSFELAKNLFLEERFTETLSVSEKLLKEMPETRFVQELNLLQTLCYLNNPSEQNLFVQHAEKLLSTSPNILESDKLRLHLFNAYVQMTDKVSFQDKNDLLDKAAHHLYIVFEQGTVSLKNENLQWLAEHFYERAKEAQENSVAIDEKNSYLEKSIAAFEFLVPKENTNLQEQTDAILFRLSNLFSWSGQIEKKAVLLEKFLTASAESATPVQKQLLLDLAKAHQDLGNPLKALSIYNEMIQNYPSSSIRAVAVLDRSQLLASYLPLDQQTEENQTYAQNLNDLKDLEVQRSLLSEPLHLEAGLEYIGWKSSLVKEDGARKKKKIQLLQLFKENFQSEFLAEGKESSDPAVTEKEQVLLSYLKFAEVEILRLEASLAQTEEEATLVKDSAQKKMGELLQQKMLPQTLKKRVEISHKELGQVL